MIDTLNDAMGEIHKMPALILDEKYMMAIFEEYLHELPPFKTYWDEMLSIGGVIIKKIASFRHKTQKFFFFGGFIPRNFLADTPIFFISRLFHFE